MNRLASRSCGFRGRYFDYLSAPRYAWRTDRLKTETQASGRKFPIPPVTGGLLFVLSGLRIRWPPREIDIFEHGNGEATVNISGFQEKAKLHDFAR